MADKKTPIEETPTGPAEDVPAPAPAVEPATAAPTKTASNRIALTPIMIVAAVVVALALMAVSFGAGIFVGRHNVGGFARWQGGPGMMRRFQGAPGGGYQQGPWQGMPRGRMPFRGYGVPQQQPPQSPSQPATPGA